jgi:hypothetical protein
MATATSDSRMATASMSMLHWVGVGLAVVTGVIHLFLGVSFITSPLGWSFLIATIGFFGGAVAVLTNTRRQLVVLLGIPFTAGQIVLWYVVNAPELSPLGIGDKIVQGLLILVLVGLYRRESR